MGGGPRKESMWRLLLLSTPSCCWRPWGRAKGRKNGGRATQGINRWRVLHKRNQYVEDRPPKESICGASSTKRNRYVGLLLWIPFVEDPPHIDSFSGHPTVLPPLLNCIPLFYSYCIHIVGGGRDGVRIFYCMFPLCSYCIGGKG